MKGLRTYAAAALCALSLHGQAQFVIEMNDGQKFTWKSFNINQQGNNDVWSIGQSAGNYNGAADLSLVKCISVTPLADQLASYKAPTYVDNYINLTAWSNRSKWNLANVHDPTVMRADDGYYYMYQTDASYGNAHEQGGHFHCRRSKNLVDWEYMGATMKELPTWVKPKLNEIRAAMGLGESTTNFSKCGYWAPCARRVSHDLYRMYYVITIDSTIDGPNTWGERAFIGLMETSNPADINSWQDKGYVITNYSDKNLSFKVAPNDWANCYFKYNAIDPSYIITPEGEHWLVYGSWHSGFPAVQLNPETGKPLTDPLPNPWGAANASAYGQRIYTRQNNNRWQGSEAPEVVYNPETGYYYLFLAYDELAVAYNTRVVRSKNLTGPYYSYGTDGRDGTNVTNGGDAFPMLTHPYKFTNSYGWVGISHCAVFDDGQGNWFYASQGRFPANANGNPWSNALMMGHVRSIRWTEEGWPVVMPERYGAVPQAPIAEAEIVGEWENISLTYQYQRQCTPVNITLNEDHSISGSPFVSYKWSWDAEKRILTIGTTKLYVQREVDWEAGSESNSTHNGRKTTIVYAGYNSTGRTTYWGKKK